jgi:hypothetical protein
VSFVERMVTREHFASRGSVRREWRRSGLTRTSTTLRWCTWASCAVAQGQGECEVSSGLGRAEGYWKCCCPGYTGQTGEGHQSDRCRPGQAPVRPVQFLNTVCEKMFKTSMYDMIASWQISWFQDFVCFFNCKTIWPHVPCHVFSTWCSKFL